MVDELLLLQVEVVDEADLGPELWRLLAGLFMERRWLMEVEDVEEVVDEEDGESRLLLLILGCLGFLVLGTWAVCCSTGCCCCWDWTLNMK